MAEFLSPVDIANRALQRVGASRITTFSDNSKQAAEVSFAYGKLRRAELERNSWRFATRRAAIRPVDGDTALLKPTLWSGSVTYFLGSIVHDANGTLWESTQRDNLNNQPQITTVGTPNAWAPYFGPMTAQQFQSQAFFAFTTVSVISTTFTNTMPLSTGYHKGELVYTYKGDGTYNVYKSRIDGNAIHPALLNQWVVSTRYKTDDVVNVYPAWSSLTSYSQGQTVNVTDASGNVTTWSSLTNSNLNNPPATSPTNWSQMPTLVLQSEFNPANINTTQIIPGTSPINEWDIFTTYNSGNFVMWNAAIYMSLINSNTGNFPSNASDWVACTGGTLYQSLVDFNLGNTPASSPSQWTTSFTLGGGNSLWIQIGGSAFPNGVAIAALEVIYPVNAGPLSQTWNKNAYRLPAGFVRRCPQDPKAGVWSWLGAPGNLTNRDWTLEGDFLVSWESQPIVLRFVADVQDVLGFEDMFSEALSCRIALEVCETLTQSTAKLQFIAQEYKKFMGEAIIADKIDQGAEEPPLDDLIACRV